MVLLFSLLVLSFLLFHSSFLLDLVGAQNAQRAMTFFEKYLCLCIHIVICILLSFDIRVFPAVIILSAVSSEHWTRLNTCMCVWSRFFETQPPNSYEKCWMCWKDSFFLLLILLLRLRLRLETCFECLHPKLFCVVRWKVIDSQHKSKMMKPIETFLSHKTGFKIQLISLSLLPPVTINSQTYPCDTIRPSGRSGERNSITTRPKIATEKSLSQAVNCKSIGLWIFGWNIVVSKKIPNWYRTKLDSGFTDRT